MNVKQAFARMQQCRELATFYRQWAATDTAGLTLREALPGLGQPVVAATQSRIRYLNQAVGRGDMNLQERSDGFTAVEVAFINVGMSTGNLDGALTALANMYEADYRTVMRAKRKATYPLMVAFCACWVPTLPIAFYVGPLAWVVVGTIGTAGVFTVGGVAIWRYFVWLRSTPRWAQIRFFWALATALEAGLGLDEALSLSAQVTAPSSLSDCLRYVVPKGRPITELLRTSGAFDEGALTMVETGELAGQLPGSLRQAARYLESGVL